MRIVLLPPMSDVLEKELNNYSSKDIDYIELTTQEFNRLWWEAIHEDASMSRSSPKGVYNWRGFVIREEGHAWAASAS